MQLTLERLELTPTYTRGKLYINGAAICDTLEDPVRDLNKNGVFDINALNDAYNELTGNLLNNFLGCFNKVVTEYNRLLQKQLGRISTHVFAAAWSSCAYRAIVMDDLRL